MPIFTEQAGKTRLTVRLRFATTAEATYSPLTTNH